MKGEKCHGGKKQKERVTLLLGANMDGTDKLKPLLIGRAKNPRCFKNIKMSALGVDYQSNGNAWMTSSIFSDFLKKWNRRLGIQKRKVLLFMDNCTAHKVNMRLANIDIKFLPANTTSVIQPMDQGIIASFKVQYRRRMVQSLIHRIDAGLSLDLSLKDAIDLSVAAWRHVTKDTIAHCFRKGGFSIEENSPQQPEPTETPQDTNTPDENFTAAWQTVAQHLDTSVSFTDYTIVDSQTPTSASLTEEEILATPTDSQPDQDSDSDQEESEPDTEGCIVKSVAMCYDSLRDCRQFMANNIELPDKIADCFNQLEDFMLSGQIKKNTKQCIITDFLTL